MEGYVYLGGIIVNVFVWARHFMRAAKRASATVAACCNFFHVLGVN